MSLVALPRELCCGTPAAPQLWDPIRRKAVLHTPEEEVRQRLVYQLLMHCNVPPHLMAVERGLQLMGRQRRFDLLVFDRRGGPLLVAECKAPSESIDAVVLHQLLRYHQVLTAPWLLLTNGLLLRLACLQPGQSPVWQESLPSYSELLAGATVR